MDLESASAYLLTRFTVPLLVVVGVIVGAVLVRRTSARRLARSGPPTATVRPATPRPDTRVAPAAPAACADRGHDLVVEHDQRTGLPATIRCARPECGATWDAVPDRSPAGGQRRGAGSPPAPRSLRPGA